MGLSNPFPSPSGHFLVVAECGGDDADTTIGPTEFVITFEFCNVRGIVSFNNAFDVGDRSCLLSTIKRRF